MKSSIVHQAESLKTIHEARAIAESEIGKLTEDPLVSAAENIIFESGENAEREGIVSTPDRFAKAFRYLLSGYEQDSQSAVGEGVFDAEGSGLVTVKSVEFYSMCEHHLLPFWGKIDVAYYPDTKILGLSKIPRLVEVFSRRMQVQERLTKQVCDAIVETIDPRAVIVKASAQHMCMMMRGVEKQNSTTDTEYLYGTENLSPLENSRIFQSLGNNNLH